MLGRSVLERGLHGRPQSAVNPATGPSSARLGLRLMRNRLLAGGAVLVVLTAAICTYSLWQGRTQALQGIEVRSRNLTTLLEHDVTSMLDKAAIVLDSVASHLERQLAAGGIDRSTLWQLVDDEARLVREISQIGVFDAAGRQVCGSEPAARCRHFDVADRDYFQVMRAAGPGDDAARLFGPYVSRADGRRSMVLAQPLRDGDGAFAGVVIALVGLDAFKSLFASIDVGASGAVGLRTESLELLVRHPGPAVVSDDPASRHVSPELSDMLARQPAGGSYRAAGSVDNVDRVSAYRHLARYPLYVLVGFGTHEFLAAWRVQAAWTLGFFALMVASTSSAIALLLVGYARQQRIQELYDNAPCGYHSVDSQGRYLQVNATELAWLGCDIDDVIGKLGPRDCYAESSRAAYDRGLRQLVDRGHVDAAEFDLVNRRDGSVRRVLVNATARRDAAGRLLETRAVMVDITELHAARERLKAQADELEARVAQRTGELRELASQLEQAENRERQQIARDLHDDLGQTLSAARIRLAALCASDRAEIRDAAARVAELIDHADDATRSLATQLAPAALYELGLVPALENLADELRRGFGLDVWLTDDGAPKPLSQAARSMLFRAIRELLINAAKHAGGGAVDVELERDDARIVVRVADSGSGIAPQHLAPAAPGSRLGLAAVRERLAFLGGSVEFHVRPGDGTVVQLTAPLSPGDDAARVPPAPADAAPAT